jgi:hypothetical protein
VVVVGAGNGIVVVTDTVMVDVVIGAAVVVVVTAIVVVDVVNGTAVVVVSRPCQPLVVVVLVLELVTGYFIFIPVAVSFSITDTISALSKSLLLLYQASPQRP